jgi:hypothetical protein
MTDEAPPPFATPVGLTRTDPFAQEHPAGSEFHQHREHKFAAGMDPADGLPRPIATTAQEDAYVPALAADTFVCMADRRHYVVRYPDGRTTVVLPFDSVREVARATFLPTAEWAAENAEHVPEVMQALAEGAKIEPIRPACAHYVRQMIDFPDNPRHRLVARFCTAQRTDTGEYISLRDAQMFSCELRSPRDTETERVLDAFDARLVELGVKERQKPFDIAQALDDDRDEAAFDPAAVPAPRSAGLGDNENDPPPRGGIFG